MSLKDPLIAELKNEAVNTRKMLERVPTEKFAWKPHDKSMTLGRLASHVAEIAVWVNRIVPVDEFDFTKNVFPRLTYEDNTALLKVFDEKLAAAVELLQNASDEILNAKYILRRGEHILVELPRKVLLRNFAFNHLVHHRGQLSVYLRLLDIPVPGMYGPSADEV
jgi:uncharacterized damage-inducible protein DinB